MNAVNNGSTVRLLWGSRSCICVYRARSLSHKKLLSWSDKQEKQLILLGDKYSPIPLSGGEEEQEGECERGIIILKGVQVYF